MDDLLDQFDDWELQAEHEEPMPSVSGKGKRPTVIDDVEERGSEDGYGSEAEASSSAQPQCPASPAKSGSDPGDFTCAICLGDIKLEEMAMVKGCDHIYCGACILHWALHKEHPWCPQCKQPFTYLLTYRGLDGELHDFPVEESVVLLKRARWFEDAMKANERAAALLDDSRLADDNAWQDYADEYDLAEDEEIEAFYFSSAAGRARVTLGNRRFGEGGYIAGGRRQARPVPTPPTSRKGKTAKGSGGKPPRKAGTAGAGPSTSSAAVAIQTPNANGGHVARAAATASPSGMSPQLSAGSFGCGTSPGCGSLVYGSSPSGSGRRAKRNARRAAASVGTPSPGASMQPVGFAAVVGGE